MRWVEMHDWPGEGEPAATETFFAARVHVGARLDDHRRVVAELEADLLARRAAAMPQPTSGEPVKVIERDVGWSTIGVADRSGRRR